MATKRAQTKKAVPPSRPNAPAKPKPDAEVVPAATLPGEGEVDGQAVAAAVEHINGIHRSRGLQMALEVGEYVTGTFFAGAPENVSERAQSHASYRALASHDGLEMSHSMLWACVAVYGQVKALPGDVAENLSFSHHRALLPAPESHREKLAKEAAARGLTVVQLQEKVAKLRKAAKEKSGDQRGRKPLPSWVKGFRKIAKVVDGLETAVSDEDVVEFGVDETRAMLSEVDAKLEILEGLKAKLEKAVEGVSGEG